MMPVQASPTRLRLQLKEGQHDFYCITREFVAAVSSSPFLEALRQKGLEVLDLCDPLDECAVQQLKEFDGKKVKSCTKEGLDVDDDQSRVLDQVDEGSDCRSHNRR